MPDKPTPPTAIATKPDAVPKGKGIGLVAHTLSTGRKVLIHHFTGGKHHAVTAEPATLTDAERKEIVALMPNTQ